MADLPSDQRIPALLERLAAYGLDPDTLALIRQDLGAYQWLI